MTQDEYYLRVLSICHYVLSGLTCLFALFPVVHLIFGLWMVFAPQQLAGSGPPPPAFVGWFFVGFASLLIVLGLTLAGFMFATGRFLARRKRHMFCLLVAGIESCFMPLGTILGVFTLVLLMREPVKAMFVTPGDEAKFRVPST